MQFFLSFKIIGISILGIRYYIYEYHYKLIYLLQLHCVVHKIDENKYKNLNRIIFRMAKSSHEPILVENEDRYVMFPIQDDEIWKMYKKQMDCFWRAEEIDLSKDTAHWEKLSKEEKHQP